MVSETLKFSLRFFEIGKNPSSNLSFFPLFFW